MTIETPRRGTMRAMSDDEDPRIARGKALEAALAERRPQGLSMNMLCRWAQLSPPTWTAVVNGKASIPSYEAFEEAIAEWDAHPDDRLEARKAPAKPRPPVAGGGEQPFTIEMRGVFGVESVTFSGAPGDADAIQEAAIDFVARLRKATGQE